MSTMSVHSLRIVRTVRPSHHGGNTAKFELEDGFYLCEAWFEKGEPRMQIRSGARGLEESNQVMVAIQLMQEWIIEELSK